MRTYIKQEKHGYFDNGQVKSNVNLVYVYRCLENDGIKKNLETQGEIIKQYLEHYLVSFHGGVKHLNVEKALRKLLPKMPETGNVFRDRELR